MRYITYALVIVNIKIHEKRVYHISVRADSKWAAPSKVLEGFYIDYPQFDNEDCRITLRKIKED